VYKDPVTAFSTFDNSSRGKLNIDEIINNKIIESLKP
jgi:hypothetical protein